MALFRTACPEQETDEYAVLYQECETKDKPFYRITIDEVGNDHFAEDETENEQDQHEKNISRPQRFLVIPGSMTCVGPSARISNEKESASFCRLHHTVIT